MKHTAILNNLDIGDSFKLNDFFKRKISYGDSGTFIEIITKDSFGIVPDEKITETTNYEFKAPKYYITKEEKGSPTFVVIDRNKRRLKIKFNCYVFGYIYEHRKNMNKQLIAKKI